MENDTHNSKKNRYFSAPTQLLSDLMDLDDIIECLEKQQSDGGNIGEVLLDTELQRSEITKQMKQYLDSLNKRIIVLQSQYPSATIPEHHIYYDKIMHEVLDDQ